MSISTKHDKVLAKYYPGVSIPRSRSLASVFTISLRHIQRTVIHVVAGIGSLVCCVGRVQALDLLALFHGSVVVVEASVCILDDERVHHRYRCRCSQLSSHRNRRHVSLRVSAHQRWIPTCSANVQRLLKLGSTRLRLLSHRRVLRRGYPSPHGWYAIVRLFSWT